MERSKCQRRNLRRDRRRAETREAREAVKLDAIHEKLGTDPPVIIFRNWYGPCGCCGPCLEGYIYNDKRFSSGSLISTSEIIYNDVRFMKHNLWTVESKHSIYRVYNLSEAWISVGASSAKNRLKYKLWPKLVMIALFLKVRRAQCEPGGKIYHECMERFNTLKMLV